MGRITEVRRRTSGPGTGRKRIFNAAEHYGAFVSDFDDGLGPAASPLAELAAHPEAPRWARECRWVPGTGHCRNRPCSRACLFRRQREAEKKRLAQARRQRRRAHRSFADRFVRRFLQLMLICCHCVLG